MAKNHDIMTTRPEIRHETAGAYLVENIKGEKVWIPKSQCQLDDGELQLPEWLAEEKGLI